VNDDGSKIQRTYSVEFPLSNNNLKTNKRPYSSIDDSNPSSSADNSLDSIDIDLNSTDIIDQDISKSFLNIEERIYIKDINHHMYDVQNPIIRRNIYSIEITNHKLFCTIFQKWMICLPIKDNVLDCLESFPNLTVLRLNNLKLGNYPIAFKNLKNLEHLDLSCNKIYSIVRTGILNIEFPKSIKTLNLSKMSLSMIPSTIYDLSNLEELYLDNNPINHISIQIENMTSLTKLSVVNSNISTLPHTFCKNLVCCDFSGSFIQQLNSTFTSLVNLERLILANCKINFIDPTIGNMKKLTVLDLTRNDITEVPDSLYTLENLRELSLFKNNLIKFDPPIGSMPNLTLLNIADNRLTEFSAGLCYCKLIEYLDIGTNDITIIPSDVGNLINMKTFKLSFNMINQIPSELRNLEKLRTFYITDNILTDLPPVFDGLKSLVRLNISNNRITLLPMNIINARNLEIFAFDNNPILSIHPSVRRFIDNVVNPEKKNLYNDNQNIHNPTMQKGFIESAQNLINLSMVIESDQIVSQILNDTVLTDECKNEICSMYQCGEIQMVLNIKYKDMFEYVWTFIHNYGNFDEEIKKEIKKIMNGDIIDVKNLCFTGKITQVLNCLNGFTPLVSMQISENEDIGNIIINAKKHLIISGEYSVEKHRELAKTKLIEKNISEDIINVWIDNIEDD
jgi:Leucine-rich repeat (LRR) protein